MGFKWSCHNNTSIYYWFFFKKRQSHESKKWKKLSKYTSWWQCELQGKKMKIQKQISGDNSINIQSERDTFFNIESLQIAIDKMEYPNLETHKEIISLIKNGRLEDAQKKLDILVNNRINEYSEELIDLATLQALINPKKSENIFEKAKNLSPDNPKVMNAYAISLMEKGENKISEKYLKDALTLSNDNEMRYKIHGNLGVLYKNTGKYEEAIENLKIARDMASSISNYEGEVRQINNLGACYHNLNKLDIAEQTLNLAKLKVQELIDTPSYKENLKSLKSLQASILTNLAITFKNKYLESSEKSFLDEAKHCLERAIDIEESTGNESQLGRHFGNLAEIYRHKGEKVQHKKYIDKNFSIFSRVGSLKDRLTSQMNKALYHSEYGEYEEALKQLNQLASNIELSKYPKLHVRTIINIAIVHRRKNKESLFKTNIEKAKSIAKKHRLEYEVKYIENTFKP